MKIPGPDHPISIAPNPRRVRVHFAGQVIAESARALTLKEATYPPVTYIPRADADMSLFHRTQQHTQCPYKGEASYFTLTADGTSAENAVWSYEQPFSSVVDIKDHLAFYPMPVTIEEMDG